ncbi:MAG: hypothetical protein NC344_07790, partial [Bacteroidales bacterium]|nr:hypothetical protein [Bacteroidales bacterium]MCM1147715.1 hypothetical protein [Bacteroidales bacterium]MCM1206756.1 hypothetical protein [Bacillota bacterium]MCM1510656.1 hypothetical protein [Clostridium sp.]
MVRLITEEQKKYILEHLNDLPRAQVAKDAGVGLTTLYRFIHAYGGERHTCRTNASILEYIRCHYSDMTAREISEKLGITPNWVNCLAKRMGVSHSPETVARIKRLIHGEGRRAIDYKKVVRKVRIRRRLEEMRVWEGKPQLTRMRLKSITTRAYKAKWHLCRH